MWAILRKLCQNWKKDKTYTGLFRLLKLCSTRFMEQTVESTCCSTPEARVDLRGGVDATLSSFSVVLGVVPKGLKHTQSSR